MRNLIKYKLIRTLDNERTKHKFHNLCIDKQPPLGCDELLTLGLKFCIEELPPATLTTGIQRLGDSLQKAWNLALSPNPTKTEQIYNPKIYLPSDWIPEFQSDEINERLLDFETELRNSINLNKSKRTFRYNLCSRQRDLVLQLQNHKDFLICQTDKNLGICILERVTYIDRALKDHLLDYKTYKRLSESKFRSLRQETLSNIKSFIMRLKQHIPPHEFTYLFRAYIIGNAPRKRIPQFYLLPKIHKTPWKTRPVVSDSGSITSFLSKWLDVQLNSLAKKHIKTLIKDSEDLRRQLQNHSPFPKEAFFFKSDAVSMYTNIDTTHALKEIKQWLTTLTHHNNDTPLQPGLLIKALDLVMSNNLFAFGDTFWKQTSGVAMGTPTACMLATIYYGIHENNHLIPTYKKNIPFLKRFIDDMIGIFIINDEADLLVWEEFKADLSFGKLTWETDNLTKNIDFLDLSFYISRKGTLTTKTYQKPLNLYLYLPPHSAHSEKLFKSIIYSTIRRYWFQNSLWEDFHNIIELYYQRLLDRGYKPHTLQTYFKDSFNLLSKQIPFHTTDTLKPELPKSTLIKKTSNPEDTQTLFFHMEFHTKGIHNKEIQKAFKNSFYNEKKFKRKTKSGNIEEYTSPGLMDSIPGINRDVKVRADRLIIALTKPKTLRDKLNPSTLHLPPGLTVNDFITKHFNKNKNINT